MHSGNRLDTAKAQSLPRVGQPAAKAYVLDVTVLNVVRILCHTGQIVGDDKGR